MTMWSPDFRWARSDAETAAIPEAEAIADSAPSSEASFSSSAAVVGFEVRV